MKIFAKETVGSIILSMILLILLSLIISKTNIREEIIIPAIIIITAVSILFGSVRVSKCKKEKGIVNGAIFGLMYMGIMYIISCIVTKDFILTLNSIIMIFSGILGGIIGGIIGVNS